MYSLGFYKRPSSQMSKEHSLFNGTHGSHLIALSIVKGTHGSYLIALSIVKGILGSCCTVAILKLVRQPASHASRGEQVQL